MVTHNRIMKMLGERRRELLDQLEAVDKAIAALSGAADDAVSASPPELETPAPGEASGVLPRRVAPKRMLSDGHKHALVTGRRKAREAKDVAEGVARELPDESFVPAIQALADQSPRLVKRRGEK